MSIVNTAFKLLALGLGIFAVLNYIAWQIPLLKFIFMGLYWILSPVHNIGNDVEWMLKNLEVYVPATIMFALWGFAPWDWRRKLVYGLTIFAVLAIGMWMAGF